MYTANLFNLILISMHILLQMNLMLHFICMGSFELQGTRSKQKISKLKSIGPNGSVTHNLHFQHSTSRIERTQLVKIIVREFLDDKLNTNSMHIIVRWTGTYIFLCIKRVRLHWNFIVYEVHNATYSSHGPPLSRTRFIPMAKHESESTYICMDNTRISEKTFFVPLGFGGYLPTIGLATD